MVSEMSVLEMPVEVQGGLTHDPARWLRRWVADKVSRWHGLYCLEFVQAQSVLDGWVARIELHRHGEQTQVRDFESREDAWAEMARLDAVLFTRTWVEWVATTLTAAGIVPEQFRGAILAGEAASLLVAADWQEEANNLSAAILLRAAYYRIRGEANVAVSAGKGFTIVYNPHVVTKRSPAKPGWGVCRAVVVEVGKSVRIVSVVVKHEHGQDEQGRYLQLNAVTCVEERIFRLGDQAEYDSYNLVYFGPVQSITAKTVVVVRGDAALRNKLEPLARLALAKFVEKNHDFNLAAAQNRNNEWMD